MLICIVVLPYSICYETRLVKNNTMCKLMEYIRHLLTYSSHMMLVSYSFELPRRIGYAKVKRNVDTATCIIITLACFYSLPTLYLFHVNPIIKGENISLAVQRTDYCHMISTDEVDKDVASINSLRVKYYAAFYFSYVTALILFLCKANNYFDRRTTRRGSTNVLVRNHSSVHNANTLMNNRGLHNSLSSTQRRILFDRNLDLVSLENYTMRSSERSNNNPDLSAAYISTAQTVTGSSTRQDLCSSNSSKKSFESDDDSSTRERDMLTAMNIIREQHQKYIYEAKFRRKSPKEDTWNELSYINRNYSSNSTNIDSVSEIENEVHDVKSNDNYSFDLEKNNSFSWLWRHRKRSNLKTSSEFLRIESYKRPLMILTALNFVLILIAIVLYFWLGQDEVILNLIHMKSVLSFYVVVITHSGLRSAIYKTLLLVA